MKYFINGIRDYVIRKTCANELSLQVLNVLIQNICFFVFITCGKRKLTQMKSLIFELKKRLKKTFHLK